MSDEPRFDIYTDAGPAGRCGYMWPIAESQSFLHAHQWATLLRTELWQVELRPIGPDMETWAKNQVIEAAIEGTRSE